MTDVRLIYAKRLLGLALNKPEFLSVLRERGVTPGDMPGVAGDLYGVLLDLDRAGPWDAGSVHAAWARYGLAAKWGNTAVVDCVSDPATEALAGQQITDLLGNNALLRLQGLAEGLRQRAEVPEADPRMLADYVRSESEAIVSNMGSAEPVELAGADDIRAYRRPPTSWVIPGMIGAGERYLFTAPEGFGKSTLLSQIALAVSAGLHPFSGEEVAAQMPTIHLDLENPTPIAYGRWRGILDTMQRRYGVQPQHAKMHSQPKGFDLMTADDRDWLRRVMDTYHPRLLAVGPLYKMTRAKALQDEDSSRVVSDFLMDLITDYDCSLIMELHAGQVKDEKGKREMRPYGSALWRWWPEGGFGLHFDEDLSVQRRRGTAAVRQWKYLRADRTWPRFVERQQTGSEQVWWDDCTDQVGVGQ